MGIIRDVVRVIGKKAKKEVVEYIEHLVEEKKKRERDEQEQAQEETVFTEVKESPDEEEISSENNETKKNFQDKKPEEKNENSCETESEEEKLDNIPKLITDKIFRIKVFKTTGSIPLDRKFFSKLAELPADEYTLYTKLYMLVHEKKKNFGYIGRNLRRLIGMEDMESENFDFLCRKLEKRGLMDIYSVSANQKGYTLFVPFDKNLMKKTGKTSKKNRSGRKNSGGKKTSEKQNSGKNSKNRKNSSAESNDVRHIGNETGNLKKAEKAGDSFYKSYKTFVSMEIDKAKMRVGRSNFDKIYMEAVKFIDKKYGFSVLSDSEKFKRHLMEYYISAFDIMDFEQWKKQKIGS